MFPKKYIIIFITICLLLIIFPSPMLSAQSVRIDTNDLLIRSGPGTQFDPLGHANDGDTFPLEEEQADWFAIEYNGEVGWVSRQYASIISENTNHHDVETQRDDHLSFPYAFKIPVEVVNLRSEPTAHSTKLDEIPYNEEVTVLDHVNEDWIEVEWQEQHGYIPAIMVDEMINKQSSTLATLQGKTIVIDPGHGGHDVGAVSVTDRYESDYALYTSRILQHQLELLGAKVYMTRDDDFYYALTPRSSLANYVHADVFLSIHYNSEPQYPSATGINTFYRNETDQGLATAVHNAVIKKTEANDRGFESGDYLILRVSKRPSLLLELGFLSNTEEEQNIQSHTYQLNISQGIIEGLKAYFND
ncbi:N-acetylmuramoyl-L-alanine amidase [Amphibacillus cookii]|uniref:N-acetylmuramoyl-L-alanine amidase n=1 Tax=Amphibacillus cookii TaxID=767787 RepID=UPI00195DAB95|nr:N-acetylmuramoyl-L-alanine amidase [Amphibacillus cookii]MBM7541728.1 N-acetylmuramoyl-L-alanine amidase [Amphibacillus cookii]